MLLKYGSIMVDAAGKLGGHTFKHTRSGGVAQRKVFRKSRQSNQLSKQLSYFAQCARLWRTATEKERNDWVQLANARKEVNILGEDCYNSAYAWFMRVNIRRLICGQTISLQVAFQTQPAGIDVFEKAQNSTPTDMTVGIRAYDSPCLYILKACQFGVRDIPNSSRNYKVVSSGMLTSSGLIAHISHNYELLFGTIYSGAIFYLRLSTFSEFGDKETTEDLKFVNT